MRKWGYWDKWWFAPVYGGENGPPDTIVAEDLASAFKQARRTWPTAQGWRCLGRVNQRDPEKATDVDAGIEERVVRIGTSDHGPGSIVVDSGMIVVDDVTAAARKVLDLYQAEVRRTDPSGPTMWSGVTRVRLPAGTVIATQANIPDSPYVGIALRMPDEKHCLACEMVKEGSPAVLSVIYPPELEQAK